MEKKITSDALMRISRIVTFNAAHRLHSKHLSEEENKELYGKCNRINGHGHNYKVKVTLQGPVSPTTGLVANLTDLKVLLKTILEELDHKNLDMDIAYFQDAVSSVENIAMYLWMRLKETEMLHDNSLLYKVKVWETELSMASYRG
ncbi:6-pyruvoyl tetrahydrobiopterin synthase-like [Watersipora subatra]|uniref:6-pyruvoyl tetrahydrobiopterin synthase-like n=1 Tax=Watersipora subatra TaxID=2589382 RepID=UPI00355B027D